MSLDQAFFTVNEETFKHLQLFKEKPLPVSDALYRLLMPPAPWDDIRYTQTSE